ncbi:MAG: type IV pilus assembly protein PilM [bacterium]|nr:type IV pilus assembly protein PilM [bacterium]
MDILADLKPLKHDIIKVLVDLSFLRKLNIPGFSFKSLSGSPTRVVGIDIGVSSSKVVQLKYDSGRAILETYGELQNKSYFTETSGIGSGFVKYLDSKLAELIKDILRESRVTTKDAVIAIPATSSFVAMVTFPVIPREEIATAIPFEARKYIPISLSEVVMDWDILTDEEGAEKIEVLVVAVPRQMIDKIKKVAEMVGLNLRAMEVETFSMARSLVGRDQTPTAIINIGSQFTTIAMVDKSRLRVSHNLSRGSNELTRTLEHSLSIGSEQAENLKKEIGLSDRPEDKEASSVMVPLVEVWMSDIERMISLQDRKAPRKIQKIILTGGGSSLKGLVEYTNAKFGIEVLKINPFSRLTVPPFIQPVLQEIGPGFSVAVGLALHEIGV